MRDQGLPILKSMLVAGLALMAPSLQGCATTGESQAQVAYNACTASYNTKRQSLGGSWAFVSGVNGGNSSCFWRYNESSAASASNDTMADCQKQYGDCFVYATSEGWSPWVKTISDNGGRDGSAQPSRPQVSTDCKLALFQAGLHLGADLAALANHQQAPFDGSEEDPNRCQK